MKQVRLFATVDNLVVALLFTWDEAQKAWICKMDDDFMQELGPLPMEASDEW